MRAQEEERKRISRELHDDTAQILFAQILRLSALKGSPDSNVQEVASTLEEMTVEALEGVRRLALELRPPALDDLGLLAALGDLAQRISDQTGIPVDYQARGLKGRMPAEMELVLYRIAQEALMNVAKHAHASHAWLDLARSEHEVTLIVRDDGTGFDLASATQRDDRGVGLGLFGMEERAHLVGGSLEILTDHGQSTSILARIPLRTRNIDERNTLIAQSTRTETIVEPIRVVLADDHGIVRAGLGPSLKRKVIFAWLAKRPTGRPRSSWFAESNHRLSWPISLCRAVVSKQSGPLPNLDYQPECLF